jgi:hypothetical protein
MKNERAVHVGQLDGYYMRVLARSAREIKENERRKKNSRIDNGAKKKVPV